MNRNNNGNNNNNSINSQSSLNLTQHSNSNGGSILSSLNDTLPSRNNSNNNTINHTNNNRIERNNNNTNQQHHVNFNNIPQVIIHNGDERRGTNTNHNNTPRNKAHDDLNNYILDVDNAFAKEENTFINEHPYAIINDINYKNEKNTILKTRAMSWADKIDDKIEATVDDAFRAINRGCEAEDGKRYREALNYYMDGSEMLSSAAENENRKQIQDLILHKACEVLKWAERLASWMEYDMNNNVPLKKRMAQSVATKIEINGIYETELMHYTPVISKDPATFTNDGYRLQCICEKRYPSLTIVITMYNEDSNELSSTLRKVCNNVQYLKERSLPGYEGNEAWKNVIVCIVSDGRKKANQSTLDYLHLIGCFDEDVMTISSTGVDVQLHLFERVINLNKTIKKQKPKPFPPLQLIFGLKEYNSGKLNSHLWYFNAFVSQLQPEYTCLLDVGTMPTKSAFYRLLSCMEVNQQIGGVCGEIAVDKPIPNLVNFIIAAQHYEYKVSNILDKAMESCFGYISVLPGAFSAYRYRAIKGKPLEAYFKSLTTPMAKLGPFQGNMYLAEDRILAFEVLAKKDCNWTMHYVKDAIARTDVPTDLTGLIGQRRRWLNGSFFAGLFGIMQWYRVYTESGHGYIRKMAFTIQYMFMVINIFLSFFLASLFHLAIYYVVIAGFSHDEWGFISTKNIPSFYKNLYSALFNGTYGICMVIQLVIGLGNKPKHVAKIYTITAVYFAIIMAMAFIIAVCIFVMSKTFTKFQIFFASAILGVYFFASAIHCEVHHIIMSFFQYVLMLPTFVNVLMTYSFCNLHDLSWGTKGIDTGGHGHGNNNNNDNNGGAYEDVIARQKAEEARQKKEAEEADILKKRFDSFRSSLLLIWIILNSGLVGFCIYFVPASKFLPILYIIVGAFNIFRLIGSIAYLIYLGRQKILFNCLQYTGILRKRHNKKQEKIIDKLTQLHNSSQYRNSHEIIPTPDNREIKATLYSAVA